MPDLALLESARSWLDTTFEAERFVGEVAWDVAVEVLVALGRMPHGLASAGTGNENGQDHVEAAIAALGLQSLRHRPVSRLSGGEKARTLLARVLAGDPEWILADEPLAALDLAFQLDLIAHLKSIARTGKGVVIVLHDLALARNHADHVIVLNKGQQIAAGTPDSSLSPDFIRSGWGVDVEWHGRSGQYALVARELD